MILGGKRSNENEKVPDWSTEKDYLINAVSLGNVPKKRIAPMNDSW